MKKTNIHEKYWLTPKELYDTNPIYYKKALANFEDFNFIHNEPKVSDVIYALADKVIEDYVSMNSMLHFREKVSSLGIPSPDCYLDIDTYNDKVRYSVENASYSFLDDATLNSPGSFIHSLFTEEQLNIILELINFCEIDFDVEFFKGNFNITNSSTPSPFQETLAKSILCPDSEASNEWDLYLYINTKDSVSDIDLKPIIHDFKNTSLELELHNFLQPIIERGKIAQKELLSNFQKDFDDDINFLKKSKNISKLLLNTELKIFSIAGNLKTE